MVISSSPGTALVQNVLPNCDRQWTLTQTTNRCNRREHGSHTSWFAGLPFVLFFGLLTRGRRVLRAGAQYPAASARAARHARAGHRPPARPALGAPPARRF